MPVDVWIRSFLQEGYLSPVTASLHDPFGFGLQRGAPLSEETTEPSFLVSCTSPALSGIDESLLLTGFLALWLSTFVLPLRAGSLRYSVLLAASQLAHGQRPGWLCYRVGASVVLEGYQPNRVARQFGLYQATAYDGRPPVPGVVDTLRMDVVPVETRLYTAALTWLHLLRLGTGSSFLLVQPSAPTGVSYTRLCWVRQSFGPALEHGARRYERRVRELGLPRGQRSRRGPPEATGDRGKDAEACTTTRAVVPSPVRVPDVAPSPPQAESSRSFRRRASSQLVTSSRRSVDARPSPRDLGEDAQEPRRSDFSGY
ncbi:uncharacterized protein LOC110094512, partial [Dendrobium catenatum]|uniref:uncharacterized protein LOC110094512 n=1 Tax=Dendrobium catenatum TaxID=906689 RepID=UPI0010A0BB0C